MKKLISFLSLLCIILLISCKKTDIIHKEIKQTEQIKLNNISANTSSPIIFNYHNEDKYSYIAYNPCTNDTVLINLVLKYSITWVTKGDTISYSYELHNAGTTGIGQSGRKYTGTGHITDNFKVIIKDGVYVLLRDNLTNKVVFTTSGGKNNLTSTAFYRISLDKDGNPTFLRNYFKWDYCH